jgi:magnesium transporter
MIEILLQDKTIQKISSIDELNIDRNEILCIHLIKTDEQEMIKLSEKFQFLLQPLNKRDEIEISSRYVEENSQIFLNLTIPNLTEKEGIEQSFVHIIILEDLVILNSNNISKISLIEILKNRIFDVGKKISGQRIALLFLSALTDYYADLIELISRRVKEYFKKVLRLKNISLEELDNLTKIKLDNIQLKECLIELQRIILQLRRSFLISDENKKFLTYENKDLAVINAHIKYNFDRLNDLKENISSKIELEQNQIIKTFTVVTVCLAPPTLIAGIYGMNFDIMPELNWILGYPLSIFIMILSIVVTLTVLKLKKWI